MRVIRVITLCLYIINCCNRCEYEATNESNQQTHNVYLFKIDVKYMNLKLQMRVINRHINSFIMDGCNRCENKSINESNQQTHNVYILWIDVTDVNIKLQIRVINRHIMFKCYRQI